MRGRAIAVASSAGRYQCAETQTTAFGFGIVSPIFDQARVYAFCSIAFIGLPWPKKMTGIRAMTQNHVVKVPVVLGAAAASAVAERMWPLRPRREKQAPRIVRDLAIGALSAIAMKCVQSMLPNAERRASRPPKTDGRDGRRSTRPLRIAAEVLLLDYTLFLWHAANHHVPFLWQFHRFHHEDLDLDTATGVRFHPGEMTLATVFRWLQLRLIKPDPVAMSIWQTMLLSSIAFHHSNTRLPQSVDDAMAHALVTPRMHGIHHSTVAEQTNSNFASLFTFWDMLHRTFDIGVPQESITIGAPR